MPIQYCKKTDKFPFTPPNIFFNDDSVFHAGSESDVQSHPTVEPFQLEEEIPDLELAVKRKRVNFLTLNLAKDHFMRNQSIPDHLSNRMLAREQEIRVVAEVIGIPANLNAKISEGFIEKSSIESFILLFLIIPFLCFTTYSYKFLFVFFLEGKLIEVRIFSCKELRQCLDTVILEDIAEVGDMVGHADLLNLVDRLCVVETDDKGTDSEVLSVFYLHSLFGNIHPCTTLASVVHYIEVLESIEFELCMFGRQPCSFNLESQSIQFGISRPKKLSFFVSSDIQETIFKDPFGATENVFDLKFLYLGNVEFLLHGVIVILLDEVHLVLAPLGDFLLQRQLLFDWRWLPPS
jgi:hypothetical protein